LILSENSMVEGDISADTLFVDGYVHGDISALTQVVISRTGRVVGNIKTKSLKLEFGGFFEGRIATESPAQ
jgi:cytoskeletal protein CcmA (bactofilin family)